MLRRVRDIVGRLGSRLGRLSRKVASRRVLLVIVLVLVVAFVLRTLLFSGDGEDEVAAVHVQVLAPGTFEASHAYAPYYVVPDKRVARPSKLSRVARNRFVTAPESALRKGAIVGSPQIVRIRVRASDDEPVKLTRVRARIVSDSRPLKGWFTASPGCVFERKRVARVNLASKQPSSPELDISFSRTRPAEIEVHASTRRRRIAWTAELEIAGEGGKTRTVSVDDGGEPFRVTSVDSSQAYVPVFGATGVTGYARERRWDDGVASGC